MKKQFFLTAMCIVAILSANAQTSVWDGSHTAWTNGTGTQNDPYLIENAMQLAHLAYIVNNGIGANSGKIIGVNTYWKLTTNIDLSGLNWTPIGNADALINNTYAFGGTFDGNGKTISNLYISTPDSYYKSGLFGNTNGASIKSIGIIRKISITGGNYAGGVIGYANSTVVDNCYITASIYSNTDGFFGGIVGYANNTVINNCYNTGSITFYSNYGGIVGYVDGTTIINKCFNTGNIFSDDKPNNPTAGGIIGYININSTLSVNNCYNTGNINSNNNSGGGVGAYAGGITGSSSQYTTINNCYNTGNINSYASYQSSYAAGIAASGGAKINNCYNTGTISGTANISTSAYQSGIANYGTINNSYYLVTCGATGGGVSETSVYMQTPEFVSLLNSGVNANNAYIQDVAPLKNNGYPILMWQSSSPTGIEETKKMDNIALYPNPVKDFLLIRSDYPVEKVEIYNQSGICVLTNNKPMGELNVTGLPDGFYLVRIYTKEGSVIKKILIR